MHPGIRFSSAYGLPAGMFPLPVPYGGLRRPSKALLELTLVIGLVLSTPDLRGSAPRLRHMLAAQMKNSARRMARVKAVAVSEVIFQELCETASLWLDARMASTNGQVSLPVHGIVNDVDLSESYRVKLMEILSTVQEPRLYVVRQYEAAFTNLTTRPRDLSQISGDVITDHVAKYMRGAT